MKRLSRVSGRLVRLLAILAALLFTLFPIYWTAVTALKSQQETFSRPPTLFPSQPTLDNVAKVVSRDDFVHSLERTVEITLASTLLCLVVGGLAAYGIARFAFPGRRLLGSAILALRIVPAITIVLPLYKLFSGVGLLDNAAAIAVVYAAVNLPFAVWLLASFLTQVPLDLEDAAQVDGASRLQVIRRVVLPLALPGVISTGLFIAILAWNEFLIPVILATKDARPLSVFIAGFVGSRSTDWGQLSAAAGLAIVPIIIFAVIVQRYVVAGLSLGAVKE